MQEIRQFRVYGYSCEYCGIMSDLSHMRDCATVPCMGVGKMEKALRRITAVTNHQNLSPK